MYYAVCSEHRNDKYCERDFSVQKIFTKSSEAVKFIKQIYEENFKPREKEFKDLNYDDGVFVASYTDGGEYCSELMWIEEVEE